NLHEQVEGDRITTYEYDLANRNIRVHFPAYAQVEVQADGTVDAALTQRPVGEMAYDAFGNLVRELKANGETIHYRYDQANRQIGAIDDMGIYTEYGYNFAGDRILTHRYYQPVDDPESDAIPSQDENDQVIEYEYDRLGRLLSESRLGDLDDADDDRINRYAYDANGNTVTTTDARGFQTTMAYDGLNRAIRSVTPSGSITTTAYDGLGNVINREIGGYSMPSFNSNFSATPTSSGVVLQWSIDRASSGIVYVRRQGTTQWQSFPDQNLQLLTGHNHEIDGLEPSTVYEYYVSAQDIFGFGLSSDTHQFTTAAGAENVTVENLIESEDGNSADISFSLLGTVTELELLIGTAGTTPTSLADTQSFTPVSLGEGNYQVSVDFTTATADTLFQLRWLDTEGNQIETRVVGLQQRQDLLIFDGEITTEAGDAEGAYDMTVVWNLPPELVQSYTEEITDADTGETTSVTRYQVYMDLIDSSGDESERLQQEAELDASGRFTLNLEELSDGARTLQLFYITPEGEMVYTDPLSFDTLDNLNLRYQRLALSFPDLDTEEASLAFRYRLVGETSWQSIPDTAINGLSVDMLGVGEGDYEFEADLTLDEALLRTSSGTFSLREYGQLQNLIDRPLVSDAADSENSDLSIDFSVDGHIISLTDPSLLPLETGETLSVTATDASGVSTSLAFTDQQIDTSVLSAGDYTLRLYKQHYDETTATTTVLNDISANLVVQASLSYTQTDNLLSFSELLPLGTDESLSLSVTDSNNQTTSYDFDDASFDATQLDPGSYTLSIRHDIEADLIVNPITLTQAGQASLVGSRILTSVNQNSLVVENDAVETYGSYTPSEYIYNYYDEMGRKLYSNENGGIWTRYFYDAQGNITREVQFKLRDDELFFIDRIENPDDISLGLLEGDYQAAVEAHDIENGVDTIREITRRYDAAGNLLQENQHSDSYGVITSEWQYDAHGNQVQEITAKGVSGEEQRTRYVYDATNQLTLINFGLTSFYDSEGQQYERALTQSFTYDSGGNRTTQTNERGYTERYYYDDHNRLISQWDMAGTLRTDYQYDPFYRVTQKSQTDLNTLRVRDVTLDYNHYDELTRITDPLLNETRINYDASGNRISETDARGNTEY
ncbi:MAG: hypothetical protein PVI97_19300, partial [Candidatus Thiodiazotropha sp.]